MCTIYHNPRCSKSRQTLALLRAHGIEPKILLYLDSPPDKETLKTLIKKLDLSVRDVLRKGEEAYKSLHLKDESLSTEALLDAIVAHPKLLERPIVVLGGRAILGRPPENVLQLVSQK